MICPKCGFEIREGLTFCPKCGLELEGKSMTLDNKGEIDSIVKSSEGVSKEHLQGNITVGAGNGYTSMGGSYGVPDFQKKRLYQKSWFIVLMLILFFPVGLFLMWRYADWSKVAKIVVTVVVGMLIIYGYMNQDPDENKAGIDATTTETTTEATKATTNKESTTDTTKDTTTKATKPKTSIKMVEGYDKLQSLYIQIDESYTKDKIIKIAEENGLYTETAYYYTGYESVYVSTTRGKLGDGAEMWYKFDTDSIEVSVFEDEKKDDGKLYASGKTYVVRDKFMSVEEWLSSSEITTKNGITGYPSNGKEEEYKDDWTDINEALDYCLNHD